MLLLRTAPLRRTGYFSAIAAMALMAASPTFAQTIPGSADAARIKPEQKTIVPDHSQDQNAVVPTMITTNPVPKGADTIHLTLKEVHIEGATVFTPEQLRALYADQLGKDVTLDKVYDIVGKITALYRNHGYFLSLAYMPEQHISSGIVTIRVVEGAVTHVEMDDKLRDHSVVRGYIDRLLAQKPLKSDQLESFLLRMNDLPGYSFRAVLVPGESKREGDVTLKLVPAPKGGKGSITFDNFGSRYLGPHEGSASYSTSLLPFQQTTVSGLSAVPAKKLNYMTLDHSIVIAPDLTLEVSANVTHARPGYTLSPEDISSESTYLGTSLAWQWIRQREENLALKVTLDGRNTSSDLIGNPFTRDHVRALRGNAAFDAQDKWQGYNIVNFTLSQGIDGLGSSKKGDTDLSRDGASPDFTKAELALTRLQTINDNWSLLAAADGQTASGTLYSSEQFGYGGQAFGRAYDSSEITGDKGVSGSLEMRYDHWNTLHPVSFQPYTYYDIGEVWNDSVGSDARESGSSAGFGVRGTSDIGVSGNLGFAWPLTREIATPIYDGSKEGPRVLLQLSKDF